jgi:hypothetical protein
MNGPDPRLRSPAPEILDYLARQPGSQDTIDGILHWWVIDTYVRKCAPKLAETVAQLVERGFLEEKPSSDGKMFYRVSPLYVSTFHEESHDP